MGFRIHRGIFQKLNAERTAYENTFKIDEDGRIKEVDSEGNITTGYLKVGEQATDADTVDGLHSGSFLRSDADDETTGALRVNKNWGSGFYTTEAFTIRGTYPSFTLRSTTADNKWLFHSDASGKLQMYEGGGTDNNTWDRHFEFDKSGNFTVVSGNITTVGTVFADVFSDRNNTSYYLDPANISYLNDLRPNIIYDRNDTNYKLDLNGDSKAKNFRTTGEFFAEQPAWGGFPLAPNLIHNSYMNKVTNGVPDGWSVLGDITIEAVSPWTKAFEGPYTAEAPSNAVDNPEAATESNPYWFGRYYNGPRIARGGMRSGWHSQSDGKILKVTGSGIVSPAHCAIYPPKEENNLGARWLFSCFVKIVRGSAFKVGTDAGYRAVSGSQLASKAQTDAGPQGWIRVSGMLGTSQITRLDGLAMSLSIIPDAEGEIEGYIALPYLANATYKGTNYDSWSGSVLDKLARQGLYIHPTNGAITSSSSTFTIGGNQVATQSWVDGNFLRTGEKAADANLLDGINSSQFLRSDTADTMSGNLKLRYSNSNSNDYRALSFWNSDSCNDYIIKASSTEGVFGRKSFGWHVDIASAFGVYSNGWTKLFGVEGGTGNAFATGNFNASYLEAVNNNSSDHWILRVSNNNGTNNSGFWTTGSDVRLLLRDNNGNIRIDLRPDGTSYIRDNLEVTGQAKFTKNVVLQEEAPTISFLDTTSGADDFYIHINSNNFYVLRDTAGSNLVDRGWDSPHPLQLEGDTNIGYLFGNKIATESYARTVAGDVESTLTPQIATAQTTADNAATAASNAQSTANTAVSTANDADANATGAKTLAGQAMTLAESKLGATAKAADSQKVDGINGASLLRSDANDTFTGTLTMGKQHALVANNYGRGVYGTYSSTRYQHVWSMGTAYNLADNGTSTGNLYGISWTHQNVGGESVSGLGHQMLIMTNGDTRSAIGDGIWTKYNVYASGGNSTEWNQAYDWGNHASAGYLTSVPNLAASKITSGTFASARIPNLAASKITSGTFANARISQSSVTQHQSALSIAASQVSGLPAATPPVEAFVEGGEPSTLSSILFNPGEGSATFTLADGQTFRLAFAR